MELFYSASSKTFDDWAKVQIGGKSKTNKISKLKEKKMSLTLTDGKEESQSIGRDNESERIKFHNQQIPFIQLKRRGGGG